MTKIVDRPKPSKNTVQSESGSERGESAGDMVSSSESIVSYRTEQGDLPAAGVSHQLPRPNIVSRISAYIKRELKDTLSDPKALASVFMLYGIIGLSAVGGYVLGQGNSRGGLGLVDLSATPQSVNSGGVGIGHRADAQSPSIVGVADAQAQALLVQHEISDQLGQMRAELLRLHTVFVRLTEIAELDDGEFDLKSPLLDWQEQSSLQKMGLLNRRIAHMSGSSSTLTAIFDLRRMAFDQKISGRPIVEGARTSGFGYRTDPITGERLEHQGLDYSGPVGEPILALADGIVTFSGKNSGYGNLVELEHVDGLRTRYAHNQAILVNPGARVKKGQAIATLGSTGRSTGPHVHIEVRLEGSPIDPGFFVR